MKDGSKIRLNNRGVALILLALGVLLLVLIFAGLAIDISYMYNVKNQLQVAADASALAGAKRLVVAADSDTSAFGQSYAREEAWKFACKNTAAGKKVYVQSSGGKDCDKPPADLNQNTNAAGGDIVVGNWDPAHTPAFQAATGGTGLRINAVKVVARRTAGSPEGPVRVFWGQVLRLIASDWSRMSAAAQAIAVSEGIGQGSLPICAIDCGRHTPLVPTGDNITPGLRFFLQCPHSGSPYMGWTTYYDNNTSNSNIAKYISGEKESPADLCAPGSLLYTTQGTTNSACEVRARIRTGGADYQVNGYTVHGWQILIPILTSGPLGCNSTATCSGINPGTQPYPYPVVNYALGIVTDALSGGNCSGDPGPYASGDAGVVFVGTGPGGVEADGTPYSTIACLPCDDPTFKDLPQTVKLVK